MSLYITVHLIFFKKALLTDSETSLAIWVRLAGQGTPRAVLPVSTFWALVSESKVDSGDRKSDPHVCTRST